ncbi:hypothetical protein [Erwinia phage Snitter]|nr:hypothetical protein [Erwinia phage Snitter]
MAEKKIKIALRDVNYRHDAEELSLAEWQGFKTGDIVEAELSDNGAVWMWVNGEGTLLNHTEFKILEELPDV